MIRPIPKLALLFLSALTALRAVGQAPDSAWVYPSATGNLLYQLDERGQRIADFSNCGYRGGSEPLPNVAVLIPRNRWVDVSPGTGDDTALIQAAIDAVEAMTPDGNGWRGVVYLNAGEYQLTTTLTINASGVVLKGAGDSATTGTRLRATDARQYTLISVSGFGSRSTVSGTTHSLTQKLVPAGTRTVEVDSASGLSVGHTVIVKRPSTTNWIADLDMDQLGPDPVVPWTAGSKDLSFDRTITRIDGSWITVDAPLPQTFESQYGGGQIWRYTWSGRIQQVGIEDLYGFSDYASSTDEAHGWKFIQINNAMHGWVRNITAQYFGYSAVSVGDGAKWLTVADSQCLDPISEITGGRRYSFNNEGAECTLFVNNYARKGRHDFVFGSVVPGPNAFAHCTADTVYADTGPHHRWSVGGLFDGVIINGNEINVQNRGNSGTGHGWAGAYMAVWNCEADGFRVRNPPTARNWLVGSIGTMGASSYPVGADPAGTYDSSGPAGTGKAVYPRSLYYGQLQQRMKWPGSEFREVWLGDVDQHYSTGGTGNAANCDTTWFTQVEALGAAPADARFDYLVGNRHIAFTVDFPLDPGDTIVAASLTVSLRAIGSAAADSIWLDSTTTSQSVASLGWTPISATAPTVRTLEVSPALLADGRLNVALGTNSAVDFAVLHLQVQKAQPFTQTITLNPVADAYVMAGVNVSTNYGTATTLGTKGDSDVNSDRETFLRWDLSGISGKIVQAKVRLAGITVGQVGNENCASFVSNDTWGETTINFTNKPAAGKLFAQWLPVAGQPVEFTVTPQVLDALLGDGKLSLGILSTDTYGTNGIVNYASRESTTVANRPQLILTIDPPDAAIKAATGSTLNLATAWAGGLVPVNPDTATWNATSLAGTMTLGTDLSWGGLSVNDPAGPLTLNGTPTLTLGNGGIDMSAATVNLTLNHPVMIGESQAWNVGAGRSLAANGPISGSWDLTKTGVGTLTLSGLSATAASNYTGTTIIGEGTLAITANGPSFTGGLILGSVNASATLGTLDLSTSSATCAGPALVRTNNVTANAVLIGSAKALTLNGGLTLGYDAAGGTGQTESKLTVTGLGSMAVNGSMIRISVNQAAVNAAYWNKGTLDVSALRAFGTNVTDFNIGVGNTTHGPGDVVLSNTANTILATTLQVGNTGSNNGRGASTLTLGTGTNVVRVDTIYIGRNKGSGPGVVKFASQTTGSPGTVTIRNKAGDGRANLDIANLLTNSSSVGAVGTLDLRGHVATVSAGTVTLGASASASSTGSPAGSLSFDAGTFDVNTLNLAPKTGASTGTSRATVHIGGGSFTVNATFTLGSQAVGGFSVATLNLTGGTFTSNADITQGGGATTSTINLEGTPATTTLNLTGKAIGTLTNPITLNARQGTLQNVATINGSGGLTKTTAGTLVLAGTNTYAGNTIISDGTLALGAGNVLPDATPVSLAAATLHAATAGTETTGTLDVTTAATIHLAAGAKIEFAASHSIDWTDGTLNLTGAFVAGSSLRFGTTAAGLTSTQLGLISATGYTGFALNASGYLTAAPSNYAAWASGQVPPVTGGPTSDSDHDGVKNLIEYALADGQERGTLTGNSLSFIKRGAPWGTDLTYEIETSTALAAGSWTTVAKPPVNETSGSISYTLTPGTPVKNFARLKVTQAP